MFTVNYNRVTDFGRKVERDECHIKNIPDSEILRSVISNLTNRYDVGNIEIIETYFIKGV